MNKFTAAGRQGMEETTYQLLRKLLRYRKSTPALQTGKTRHFIPEDGIYVYFRYDDSKRVMMLWNTTDKPLEHKLERYVEMLKGYRSGRDVVKEETVNLDVIRIEPFSLRVIELQ